MRGKAFFYRHVYVQRNAIRRNGNERVD